MKGLQHKGALSEGPRVERGGGEKHRWRIVIDDALVSGGKD